MSTDLFYLERTSQLLQVTPEKTLIKSIVDKSPSQLLITTVPEHLQTNVIVVDSIKSGTRNGNIYETLLKPVLDTFEVNHQYHLTTSPTSIHEFASKLDVSSTVIFLSGDTSINEFINGLPKGNAKLTIFPIPLGTANSLSLSLNIQNEVDAIQKLFTTKPVPFNLYEVDFPKGSYYQIQDTTAPLPSDSLKFIVVFSWGFHAALVADSDTPEFRKFGLERFKLAAFENLKTPQKYEGEFKLQAEGPETQIIEGPFAYWVLTPSRKFEPTFEILPKGNILDDSLYLISFNTEEDPEGSYIMEIMGQAYDHGSHVDNKKVIYKKVLGGQLTTRSDDLRNRRFCLDGSIIVVPKGSIEIRGSGNKHRGWDVYILG